MNCEHDFLKYVQPLIEKDIYDFFASSREKVLFGKGRQARIITDVCGMVGGVVQALVSTEDEETKEELLRNTKSYTLKSFPESKKKNSDVLIAVNEKWNDEIQHALEMQGFLHVYKANNWNAMNHIFRTEYFEFMMQDNEMDANEDILCKANFKIWNWKQMTKEYEESFLVEAVDILYPFLFNDVKACVEGPYEYSAVTFEGGVVIDAGANIGMFSCCAASRKCKVYAFEPTKTVRDYLRKNSELYPGNIEVVEYALSDKDGIADFVVNDTGEGTMNRLAEVPTENSHLEKVPVISLDAFIESRGERVDFIKADIEGAERKLLLGAQQTLKKYAPKLSLCTYHLPDDKEILTKLVLHANPRYRIVYGWHKLYAYVPEKRETKY